MIYVASDHGGFELKNAVVELLGERDIVFTDFGAHDLDSVDYPDYAHRVAKLLQPTPMKIWGFLCVAQASVCQSPPIKFLVCVRPWFMMNLPPRWHVSITMPISSFWEDVS